MELRVKLESLSEKVIKMKEQINNEEATKNALIMPFLSILGYDVFDPTEVKPEFTADIGLKKGEKVDYCICKNGAPIILIECKHYSKKLESHASQLHRYYNTTKAKFAILTNGITYQFFTDIDTVNVMDLKPFLEFDITDLKDSDVNHIRKFCKSNYNVDSILTNANSLKYIKELKKMFNDEITSPSDDFVKLFASKVYNKRLTEKTVNQFKEWFQISMSQQISEIVNNRLKSALNKEEEKQSAESEIEEKEEPKILTTEEELQAYYIVLSILRNKIDSKRVVLRDKQRYCGVLLDDNNRKPICRFHFNTSIKYIGIFDSEKNETKIKIDSIDDIYNLDGELLSVVDFY